MPQFIIPLVTLAISGIEMGMQAAGVGQPSTSGLAKQQQDQANKAALDNAISQRKALLASRSDAQSQVGGSLTDQSMLGLMGAITGQPGAGLNMADILQMANPTGQPGGGTGSPIPATPHIVAGGANSPTTPGGLSGTDLMTQIFGLTQGGSNQPVLSGSMG